MLRIEMRPWICQISGENSSEIKHALHLLSKRFSYKPSSAKYIRQHLKDKLVNNGVNKDRISLIMEGFNDNVCLIDNENAQFPAGLAQSVLAHLKDNSFDFKFSNLIPKVDKRFNWHYPKNFEPRDHQNRAQTAANGVLSAYNCMVNRMATGAGKTFSACMTIADYGLKTMFIVPSKMLLQQAYEDFCYFFGDDKVGRIGDGYNEIDAPITIAIINSLASAYSPFRKLKKGQKKIQDKVSFQVRRKAIEDIEFVMMDEVHNVPVDLYIDVLSKFVGACYIQGFTATDRRKDGSTIRIEAASGATSFEVTAAECIDAGLLVNPMIYFQNAPTKKDPVFLDNRHKRKFYINYSEYFKYNVIHNEDAIESVAKSIIKDIDDGKHILVAINRIEHGDMLLEFLDDDKAVMANSQTHNAWTDIKAFRDKEFPVLISTLCSEGFNAPAIDSLVIAQDTTDSEQIVGRGIRTYPGKNFCKVRHIYYSGESGVDYLRRHAYECREIYQELGYPVIQDIVGGESKNSGWGK